APAVDEHSADRARMLAPMASLNVTILRLPPRLAGIASARVSSRDQSVSAFGHVLNLDRSPQDSFLRASRLKARPRGTCGLLPLPKGEGWGEGLQTIERSVPPPPTPLPVGERESRRASLEGRVRKQSQCQR